MNFWKWEIGERKNFFLLELRVSYFTSREILINEGKIFERI